MTSPKGRELPDLVHGAWARRCLTVGAGERFETQHVVWIQAGACFADVRVPFHPDAAERAFAGRSGWAGSDYRWSHGIDLYPISGDDTGQLSWEDGLLVERGIFPSDHGEVAYVEWWERLDGADGPFVALEAPGACLVRAGGHAITVVDRRESGGDFAACYRVHDRGRWTVKASIGDGASLPSPDEAPRDWRVIHSGSTEVVTA